MGADAHDAETPTGGGGGLAAHVRRLGRQTLIYGVGGVALQLVGIVTLPIFARVFSPADYGVIELASVVMAILMIVVDGGMASASQRSYFDHGDDAEAQRRRILVTALLFQLALSAIVATALALFAGPLSRALFDGREAAGLLMIVGAMLPAFALAQFTREILRLEFRAWSYLASSIAGAAVGAAISILAVVTWDQGVEGPFIGLLAGSGVSAVYGLALVWRRLVARPSRRELDIMLRFGLHLIPTALSLWALSLIDRVMLARLADLDELGQYAIASRIALPVLLLVTALGVAFSPFALSLFQEDPQREKDVRARVLTDFIAALALTGLVFALWAQELTELVAPAFDEAFRAVGLVAFGLVAFGISSVAVAGISFARETKWLTLYSGAAALLNIALNLVLIPPLGMIGAGVATLCAYILLAILYYRRAQILYRTAYRGAAVAGIFVAGVALSSLGAVDYDSWLVATAVKLGAVGAFLLALRALGVIPAGGAGRALAWARSRTA
jgi:O-antigen/teichoic acid export membrane protein